MFMQMNGLIALSTFTKEDETERHLHLPHLQDD